MATGATGTPTSLGIPTINGDVDDPTEDGVNSIVAYIDSILLAIHESQFAFTDVTTGNASTTKHGLVPKLPNDATKYYDGTGAYSVPPTNTDPTMGGDLSGTASNAQIVAGAVGTAEVAAANKDGAVGTASMRTLGTGAAQAAAGNDARFPTAGTSFPGSPVDGQEYIYVAAAGVHWRFRYYTTGSYWAFVGGPPLVSQVDTSDSLVINGSYAASTTPGPAVAIPFAGDYDVEIGAHIQAADNVNTYMSYDIGGTGAVDADALFINGNGSYARRRRQTGLTAVTLTAKYKGSTGNPTTFANRYIAVWPVKK